MKIGVFGGGEFGLALSDILANNNQKVIIFDRNPLKVDYINKNHTIPRFENYQINHDIIVSNNLNEVVKDSDYIILATTSNSIKLILKEILPLINKDVIIINAAKGFDLDYKMTLIEVIENMTINNKYIKGIGSILGPGFAIEIIKKNLTCVCSVSKDLNVAKKIQELFSNNYFRVYSLTDTIGAQIGTSLKNAIAIASGAIMGLGYGENSKASLITRGLAEITRFGLYFKAEEKTFLGLTGLGDLVLTCNSNESRNFQAGYIIGTHDDVNYFFEHNNLTVEGINTIKVVYEIATSHNIDMPIINGLYQSLFEKVKPSTIINMLMERPLKEEKR